MKFRTLVPENIQQEMNALTYTNLIKKTNYKEVCQIHTEIKV